MKPIGAAIAVRLAKAYKLAFEYLFKTDFQSILLQPDQ